MPRTKLDRVHDPHEKYRGLVIGRMFVLGMGISDLADKMNISRPTAQKYVRDPGVMPLNTMRKLNRVLDITAEAARDALAVK